MMEGKMEQKRENMAKTIIIHDLEEKDTGRVLDAFGGNSFVFLADSTINHCIGCFGCWLKTPGLCTINNQLDELLHHMSECENFVIISRCFYGGLSADIKTVLDRCIAYVQPYFYINKGKDEMHHVPRYDLQMKFYNYYYGAKSDREKETAKRLAAANALNFNAQSCETEFYNSSEEIFSRRGGDAK